MHWLPAQEEAREKTGANMVFAQDRHGRDVALIGNPLQGWRLVTPEGMVRVNTSHGLEAVLEELHLPFHGWS